MYTNGTFWPYVRCVYIYDMYLNRTFGQMHSKCTFLICTVTAHLNQMYPERTSNHAHKRYILAICTLRVHRVCVCCECKLLSIKYLFMTWITISRSYVTASWLLGWLPWCLPRWEPSDNFSCVLSPRGRASPLLH